MGTDTVVKPRVMPASIALVVMPMAWKARMAMRSTDDMMLGFQGSKRGLMYKRVSLYR